MISSGCSAVRGRISIDGYTVLQPNAVDRIDLNGDTVQQSRVLDSLDIVLCREDSDENDRNKDAEWHEKWNHVLLFVYSDVRWDILHMA